MARCFVRGDLDARQILEANKELIERIRVYKRDILLLVRFIKGEDVSKEEVLNTVNYYNNKYYTEGKYGNKKG